MQKWWERGLRERREMRRELTGRVKLFIRDERELLNRVGGGSDRYTSVLSRGDGRR